MLTQKEKRLRTYLKVLLGIYLIILAFCIINLFKTSGLASAILSITVATLAFVNILLCWYAISDLRRFTLLVKLIIWGAVVSAIVNSSVLLWHDTSNFIFFWNISLQFKSIIIISIVFDILVAVITFILLSSAERARYGLKYFSPLQFKTLESLAEVIIYGEEETISSEEVAKNVDTYFNIFQANITSCCRCFNFSTSTFKNNITSGS